MEHNKTLSRIVLTTVIFFFSTIKGFAQEIEVHNFSSILQLKQYDRAIHIMAMLLIGFGFLMVFVKKYGRSALTATFLLVSISLPLYISVKELGIFEAKGEIEQLILAEFGAASLLIAAGALFGIAAAISLTTQKDMEVPIESDATTDKFSVLGSMVLWVFWPSFCAALVPIEAIPHTVVNVFIALCGSTIATYIASVLIRGKVYAADIANASLAGGVAIGATCDFASHPQAMIIGAIAGILSTIGFAVLQNKQQKFHKIIDTCGVSNLHGIPGIFGGLAAIVVIHGLDIAAQLKGILITVVIAIVAGFLSGKVIAIFGKTKEIYNDCAEFIDAD